MRVPSTVDFTSALPMIVAQAEMQPRERLVWAERAVRGTGLRQMLARMTFGVFFAGFAVFWMAVAFLMSGDRAGEPDPVFRWFPYFGVPFFAIGISMVIMPLLQIGAPPAVYALSTRRVIIISGRHGERVRSYDLEGLADVQRMQRADGSGDILFDRRTSMGRRDGLYGVPDVRRTADELERLRSRAVEEAGRLTDQKDPTV